MTIKPSGFRTNKFLQYQLRTFLWTAIMISMAGLEEPAFAKAPACSPQDAKKYEKSVDSLHSWQDIESVFKNYARCDEGASSEEVSEAIARQLVDHWSSLPELGSIEKTNPAFIDFVLDHIDSTLNDEILAKISSFADNNCPAGASQLCKKIAQASVEATKD